MISENNHKILTTKEKQSWNHYLEKLPIDKQDIYYTPNYYKIYENYGDGKAYCFVFQEENSIAIYPFLKNSINKLGYDLETEYYDIQGAYGYNGIISNNYEKSFKNKFFKEFEKYCNSENIIAEFTRFHPLIKNHMFTSEKMDIFLDRKTVFLDVTKKNDEIWANSYSSNNRNMIRKALKNNIKIFESKNKDSYFEFYKIYTETMKNVGSEKYLFFNENYFIDFINLLPSNHKLILAKIDNQIVGGMILMFSKNFAHYHLSSRKAKYGKFALNNLFLDYAIKEAKKEGCKLFHFGGGTNSDPKNSLLKFKLNFSKDKSNFYFGKKIYNFEVYNKIINIWEQNNKNKKESLKKVLLRYRM